MKICVVGTFERAQPFDAYLRDCQELGLEAIELILEPGPDGTVRARIMPRQTSRDAAAVLGYTEETAVSLGAALGAESDHAV